LKYKDGEYILIREIKENMEKPSNTKNNMEGVKKLYKKEEGKNGLI
jgi:hypothetical protein